MKKLIKRKDGSYSQRGLWDNIRANKGSGKEPTKQMLKQESKIKKEESMNSMYKKGGKASKKKMMNKESFLEESKEMEFGAPGVTPPKKKFGMGGKRGKEGTYSTEQKNRHSRASFNKGGFPDLNGDGKTTFADVLKGRGVEKKMMGGKYEMGGGSDIGITTRKNLLGQTVVKTTSGASKADPERTTTKTVIRKDGSVARENEKGNIRFNAEKGISDTDYSTKKRYDRSGNLRSSKSTQEVYKDVENEIYPTNTLKTKTKFNKEGDVTRFKSKGFDTREDSKTPQRGNASFKTGGKSMAPGGGGRFEAMVNKLKSRGKSEEAAEGIAASAGRAKYGKDKFQAMAAKGRKKG